MKVIIKESGGLAPGLRRPARTVDSDELSDEKAAKLLELVNNLAIGHEKHGPSNDRARDAVKYSIAVEDDEGLITTMEQSDSTLTQPVADLIDWVNLNN